MTNAPKHAAHVAAYRQHNDAIAATQWTEDNALELRDERQDPRIAYGAEYFDMSALDDMTADDLDYYQRMGLYAVGFDARKETVEVAFRDNAAPADHPRWAEAAHANIYSDDFTATRDGSADSRTTYTQCPAQPITIERYKPAKIRARSVKAMVAEGAEKATKQYAKRTTRMDRLRAKADRMAAKA